jgi:hypothetical protein
MADSTAVAIVGVLGGTVVALASPLITARKTTAGQKRLFEHQERMDDRRELRELLDEVVSAIDPAEVSHGALVATYGASGLEREAYGAPLRECGEAIGVLESCRARLAVRLGDGDVLTVECGRAIGHARSVVNSINRYLTVPMVSEPPGLGKLGTDVSAISDVSRSFVVAAKRVVGARIGSAPP